MNNEKDHPKCQLCLKSSETHVKMLGTSEVTKGIEELFHIKINDGNTSSIAILCIKCHNTVAEFYKFYTDIKTIHATSLLDTISVKEEVTESDLDDPNIFDNESTCDDAPIETLVQVDIEEKKDDKILSETKNNEPKKVFPSRKKKKTTQEVTKDDPDDIFWMPPKKVRKVYTYSCDICKREFKKYSFMKAHILQKHLNIFEDVCPHCGKTSFDKSTLKRHIDAVHLKTYKRRRDICPDCGVAVVALKLHRQLKHGIGAKVEKVMYSCDQCSLQYTKLMYLKRHIARKHLKQFDDKCPYCQKHFYNRMSVERHMQSQHPDLVPEEVKRKRLMENITSPCDLCEKVFHRRANYLRHRRTVHKDVPMLQTNAKIEIIE